MNGISDIVNKLALESAKILDNIIKETAEQGYEYMLCKKETKFDFDNNKVTCNYNYHGFHSVDSEMAEWYNKEGFEVYDLKPVKEYLKNLKEV